MSPACVTLTQVGRARPRSARWFACRANFGVAQFLTETLAGANGSQKSPCARRPQADARNPHKGLDVDLRKARLTPLMVSVRFSSAYLLGSCQRPHRIASASQKQSRSGSTFAARALWPVRERISHGRLPPTWTHCARGRGHTLRRCAILRADADLGDELNRRGDGLIGAREETKIARPTEDDRGLAS